MSGLDLMETLQRQNNLPPVIVMTGRSDATLRQRARDAGAREIFDKPVDEDVLLEAIDRVWAH
jgi:FixJ family two-component response regulator